MSLARARSCRVFNSDQRIAVTTTGMFTYPDVGVVCGKPQFHPKDGMSLLNPVLLVEVLSKSTSLMTAAKSSPITDAILPFAKSSSFGNRNLGSSITDALTGKAGSCVSIRRVKSSYRHSAGASQSRTSTRKWTGPRLKTKRNAKSLARNGRSIRFTRSRQW